MLPSEWPSKCASELINFLSRVHAPPWPHLMVVGPKTRSEEEILERYGFFAIPPNLVGYDLEIDKAEKNPEFTTVFDFFYRIKDSEAEGSDSDDALKHLKIVFSIRPKLKVELSDGTIHIEEILASGKSKVIFNGPVAPKKVDSGVIFEYIYRDEITHPDFHHEYEISFTKFVEIINTENYLVKTRLSNNGSRHIGEMQNFMYGYLLKFFAEEHLHGGRLKKYRRTLNVVPSEPEMIESNVQKIKFEDHATKEETIYKLKLGLPPEKYVSEINQKKGQNFLDPSIGQAFGRNGLGFEYFYDFQQKAIEHLLDCWRQELDKVTMISVRTAGGKTEAFIIPILQYCIEHLGEKGTKAIIFYPTKALANDQANRIHRMLYYLNKLLIDNGYPRKISLGIYHGDVSNNEVNWVIYKCPIKENGQECRRRLEPLESDDGRVFLRCPHHGEVFDYLRMTRFDVYSTPPDILISNPDILNVTLLMRPEAHSLFGRKIRFCARCRQPYANVAKRTCDNEKCVIENSQLVTMDPQCVPKFLVFDESHMLKGALGINISYILSRFRRVLNHYHYQKFGHPYKPILIGSTATIKAPEEFASCLFNIDKSKVDLKPPDVSLTHEDYPYVNEKDEETIRRFHVLLMPSAYFAQDTVTNIVLELLTFFACEGEKVGLKDLKPQVLGFVNSIREANDLISRTRHRITRDFPNISVDGHNTDFDKVQRAEVEKKFNERGVNILYATRTLEVGVDFDDIDTLLVFGAPFSYNDYLQRIGRAGRKRDALIVTVLRNFIPIDNYYFEHSKELIDQDLHKYNIERVPILRDNPHIKKKSVIASAFGYMAVHEDADKFQEDVKRFDRLFYSERGDWLQSKEYSKFVDWVFESLEGSLSRSECEDILKHEFLRKLHDICEKESFRSKLSLAEILEDFNKFYFLFSIRMCDPEVGVSFE